MSTGTLRAWRVTVTLTRPFGDDALLPPQLLAEAAAALFGAEDLMCAWTSARTARQWRPGRYPPGAPVPGA